MSNGDYDQDLRKRDAMFLKEYMIWIEHENVTLLKESKELRTPHEIFRELLHILEKGVRSSVIKSKLTEIMGMIQDIKHQGQSLFRF